MLFNFFFFDIEVITGLDFSLSLMCNKYMVIVANKTITNSKDNSQIIGFNMQSSSS